MDPEKTSSRSKDVIVQDISTESLGPPTRRIPETAWQIYNRRAAIYDKELIKDWNNSLNTLLIFVSCAYLWFTFSG